MRRGEFCGHCGRGRREQPARECLRCGETAKIRGRGLCCRCYYAVRRYGREHEYPTRTPLYLIRAEEYEHLRPALGSLDAIALAMGIRPDALRNALYKAGYRSPHCDGNYRRTA